MNKNTNTLDEALQFVKNAFTNHRVMLRKKRMETERVTFEETEEVNIEQSIWAVR